MVSMRAHVGEAPGAVASLTQDPSRWSQRGGTRLSDSESSRGEPDKSTDRSDSNWICHDCVCVCV